VQTLTQISPLVSASPIGVAVFGVSTPFAYSGFHIVRVIVEAVTGETLSLHLTNLQQLRERFEERGGGSVVVTSDFPDEDLIGFLINSALPLIAFGDDMREMVEWTAHSRRMSMENAIRFCSNIVCVLTPAFLVSRTLVLGPGSRPSAIVAAIVAHLFPNDDEGLAARLYETLVQEGKLSPDGFADWRLTAEPLTRDAVRAEPGRMAELQSALMSYGSIIAGRLPVDIEWPVALFTCPDTENWREPIDLTGPARIVMYGPYLHLPAGKWVARVEFEIDGAISGVEAATDVFISEVLVEKVFVMPRKGIFAFELGFEVSDPRHAVEIRLSTKRSAIEGLLLVRSVVVRAG
jgi:hypothetical protein